MAEDAPPEYALPGDTPLGDAPPGDVLHVDLLSADFPPNLALLLATAMPTPPALTIQQQSDGALMLLRCDWKEEGVVAHTLERLTQALGFIAELAHSAAWLGVLQGAVLQALLAWLAREQRRLDQARRLEPPKEGGAEGYEEAFDFHAARQTLSSAGGARDEPSPLLTQLGPATTRAMAVAADDLRKLLRVKVADDQDLKTARQALAEAAYFFAALQQEAKGLGISADEQLKQYTF